MKKQSKKNGSTRVVLLVAAFIGLGLIAAQPASATAPGNCPSYNPSAPVNCHNDVDYGNETICVIGSVCPTVPHAYVHGYVEITAACDDSGCPRHYYSTNIFS